MNNFLEVQRKEEPGEEEQGEGTYEMDQLWSHSPVPQLPLWGERKGLIFPCLVLYTKDSEGISHGHLTRRQLNTDMTKPLQQLSV